MREFWFQIREFLATSRRAILNIIDRSIFGLSILALGAIIVEYGFAPSKKWEVLLHGAEFFTLFLFGLGQILRPYLIKKTERQNRGVILGVLSLLVAVGVGFFRADILYLIPDLRGDELFLIFHVFTGFVFLIEVSRTISASQGLSLNPASLFMVSFLLLIFAGAGLLMLPEATTKHISFLDALFTSTSAVCVTGLSTLSTSTDFTLTGKIIILLLIQVGGLGIMTFTSFFGLFFQGTSSLKNRLYMRDFLNEDNVNLVFSTLTKVVGLTFLIELLGALFIYLTTLETSFSSEFDHIFFSVFHSISAFCNAGFSTLGGGLADQMVVTNYNLHLVIAMLIILGGLGFPIMFNFFNLGMHYLGKWTHKWFGKKKPVHRARLVNVNARLAMTTTIVLLLLGFGLFLFLEWDHTLAGKTGWEKFVLSVFGSVTPRTAGFNTVDMTAMAMPTVLFYLLFMWIGASPGSTGGGIKTTTIAVGFLNVVSVARGKDRTEVFRRRVSDDSIKRAFVAIMISIMVILLATFFLTITEPDKDPTKLLFEAFSAVGTVGLSLNLTPELSSGGKFIIIICMFVGRMGMLTLITAFFRKVRSLNYTYPSENIQVS